MNTKQRILIYACATTLGIMFLVPPWRYYYSEGHVVTNQIGRYKEESTIVGREEGGSAGYRLIVAPSYKLQTGQDSDGNNYIFFYDQRAVYLDVSRLLVQFAFIAVVAGSLFIALRGSVARQ